MRVHGTSHRRVTARQAWNPDVGVAFTTIPHGIRGQKHPGEEPMRQALLISVAALALAAVSPTLTLAQNEGGAPGASGRTAPAGTNAPAANPSGTAGPTTGAPGAAQQQPSESPAPPATA